LLLVGGVARARGAERGRVALGVGGLVGGRRVERRRRLTASCGDEAECDGADASSTHGREPFRPSRAESSADPRAPSRALSSSERTSCRNRTGARIASKGDERERAVRALFRSATSTRLWTGHAIDALRAVRILFAPAPAIVSEVGRLTGAREIDHGAL